jgi:hypothetical protein
MGDEPRRANDRTRTPEEWQQIRKAYEGGESEASIGRRLGIDRKTIRKRRIAEHWTPQVSPHVGRAEAKVIQQRAQAKVVDIATGKAIETLQADGTLDAIAAEVGKDLLYHARIAAGLMMAADDLLTKFVEQKDGDLATTREQSGRDIITREGRVETYQKLVTSIRGGVELTRAINGKKPGEPSTPNADEERKSKQVRRFVLMPAEKPADLDVAETA